MFFVGVVLTGRSLTFEEIEDVARRGAAVSLAPEARERVEASRAVVDEILRGDRVVYGINTGFGNFRNVVIAREDLEKLQLNLVRSHSAGVGNAFPETVVRAILLLRANALASGYSGIDPGTLDALVAMLNAGVHPVVPEKGSVGASGDLAPLAHVALTLIGEGEAVYRGEKQKSSTALARAGLSPAKLHPKDGLALINGTQVIRRSWRIRSSTPGVWCAPPTSSAPSPSMLSSGRTSPSICGSTKRVLTRGRRRPPGI
jgi:histidine ammonia-lyase